MDRCGSSRGDDDGVCKQRMRDASRLRWPAKALTMLVLAGCAALAVAAPQAARRGAAAADDLNTQLEAALANAGFTGNVESTLLTRMGRSLDPKLVELGRRLFFDPLTGLHDDNSCAGCHAPNAGFGDSQSIAIGVQNNNLVGPDRKGPRNQRRTPSVINTAFFPRLMWNGRFHAPSGDPFDNSQGFAFPNPEGTTRFPANDPVIKHLLIAQAHIPVTELNEAAGFTGTRGTISPRFDDFDDGKGGTVPMPDGGGFRNDPIRDAVIARLNATPAYRNLFGDVFPDVKAGGAITVPMYARAIAEFEFTLVRADAPIDRFARGQRSAMSNAQKRGALLFFGKAGCVGCHAVAGQANEMFSDFQNRNIAVPQIAPFFGVGKGNTIFDGPGEDEDFGLEQVTGNSADRYKFRTSPLRNVALQPAFFHNGAYTKLEDAIRHHLDVARSSTQYDAAKAGVAKDLRQRRGPSAGQLLALDPLLATPINLTSAEFSDLLAFVGDGLLDQRLRKEDLCAQIPKSLPSKFRPMKFQGCGGGAD